MAAKRIVAIWRRRLVHPIVRQRNAGRRIARARQARARAKRILSEAPDPSSLLDGFEESLRALLARARKKCSRVLLVRQPWLEKTFTREEGKRLWMFGAGRARTETTTTYYAHEVVWKLLRRIDERLLRVAEDLGVDTLDLGPVVPPTFDLWYDEMHHNARGCERIGLAVAEELLKGR